MASGPHCAGLFDIFLHTLGLLKPGDTSVLHIEVATDLEYGN